jgi:hypothetical protein
MPLIAAFAEPRSFVACVQAAGMDRSIFWRRNQFHLTLAMLKLHSAEEVANVVDIFAQVAAELAASASAGSLASGVAAGAGGGVGAAGAYATGNALSPGAAPLRLALGGLEIMNDDPSETHVVFVDVVPDAERARLEHALYVLQQRLDSARLLDRRERERMFLVDQTFAPKLHATVINTRLRRGPAASTASDGASAGVNTTTRAALTPAEMATQGVSMSTATGRLSATAQAAADKKAAGLKRDYGERVPVDTGKGGVPCPQFPVVLIAARLKRLGGAHCRDGCLLLHRTKHAACIRQTRATVALALPAWQDACWSCYVRGDSALARFPPSTSRSAPRSTRRATTTVWRRWPSPCPPPCNRQAVSTSQ